MFCKSYFFCCLTFVIVVHRSIQNDAFVNYAVRTNLHPTTSCLQVHGVKSKLHCFSTCLMQIKYFYLFSHNNPDQACACCVDLTGSALNGTNWRTYIPPPCPDGYISYPYTYFVICLKYVAMGTTYPDAVNYCNADGGDLIRLDSLQKYDMLKDHLAPYAVLNGVQVWVQAVERGTEWKFHDGTPFPNYCPIQQSNTAGEISLRVKSPSFVCIDAKPTDMYHYMCEVYRRFS